MFLLCDASPMINITNIPPYIVGYQLTIFENSRHPYRHWCVSYLYRFYVSSAQKFRDCLSQISNAVMAILCELDVAGLVVLVHGVIGYIDLLPVIPSSVPSSLFCKFSADFSLKIKVFLNHCFRFVVEC